MKKCGIFRITGDPSLLYVGTSKDVVKLWQTIRFRLKKGTFYNKGIQDYYDENGIDALKFTILEEVLPEDLQRTKEILDKVRRILEI